MMNPRLFDLHNRTKKGSSAPSLDDLVEEDKTIANIEQRNARYDDSGEDELEAYMATIQQAEETNQKKKAKISLDDLNSDDEDGSKIGGADASKVVDDIRADVEAAIAGINSSANKTTNRLKQLSNKNVTYIPFKKDFYQEVPELAQMTKEEVEELRMSLENIKVAGKSCPKPVICWAHCGLSKKVMEVLKKSNYSSPTPIQAQAIPAIMSGRDVIGIAKTGCGKTLSFLLPMFRHILAQPQVEKGDGPIAVIITPTRELATQICDDAMKFTKVLGLRVVSVYGGPNISEQIGMLKPGAEIVVCTPGRMIEVLTVNNGRVTNLNRCTYLVMDEADRLFDMGFEKQIRSIVDLIRPDRQTVMFSATFPKILEAHARKILHDPILIQVGGRSVVCKDVSQSVEIIEEDDKFLRLLPVLQKYVDDESSAIIFVSKQEKADSLLEDLMQAYDPNCLVLHGGIDKDDRISTFASFKKGNAKVLVATSVAARGLDVKNCILVVNYDCPNHYEDYVHRCGRTGRAGKKGFAYTFITPDQGQYAADIIKAFELSGNLVPEDIQRLWDNYKADAEKLGKKVWTSSGFSGRGFKFDEAEARMVSEKKKYQKKSLGLHSSDEEDEGGDADNDLDTAALETEIKNLVGNKKSVTKPTVKVFGSNSKNDTRKPIISTAGSSNATSSQAVGKSAPTFDDSNQNSSKLDLAKQRALMLCKKKGLDGTFGTQSGSNNAKIASSPVKLAPDLQSRLAPAKIEPMSGCSEMVRSSVVDATSTTKSIGHERLEMQMEINDFHQQVRRRLTSKEALLKISEACEVGITVRGMYCAQGDRPTEPKLYLAIEGTSQTFLEKAHKELLLLVKEEYNRMNSQPATRGRFRIV